MRRAMESETAEGLLLVDKRVGMTSHDAVALARRALRTKRIGHAGTLDPFASGLLVLLVGRATRLLPYLDGEPKVYDTTIRFGVETDSGDLTGHVVRESALPTRDAIRAGIAHLTGEIEQIPPQLSAKKVAGVRAYAAARRGETLTLAAVKVIVHEWRVRAWRDDEIDVTIACGGGTYVRALARDLGELSGSAAHLTSLRRISSGPFDVAAARTVDELHDWTVELRPSLDAVSSLPRQRLDEDGLRRVMRGMSISAETEGAHVALVDTQSKLVAIAERLGAELQPRVVLRDS
jgi:tRNA pseudouridine55 synthase